MDSIEVRRLWLKNGGDASETARQLSETGKQITRQGVQYHVEHANKTAPLPVPAVSLTVGDMDIEDQDAIRTYVREALDRAGIAR